MRNYNNEEEVKVHLVLPWLEALGYKREFMEFEKTIKITEGRKTKSIFADIVVYTDKKLETPLIVVDTKSPSEILSKAGRDQVISYARLLPKIAPIAVLTNGTNTQVYQTLDKSRIKELPVSPQIIELINRLTTGSTKESRARFKEEQFLKLYVPIPKNENVFLEIVSAIRQINQFKKDIKKLYDRLDVLPISYRSTFPFMENKR